jgi:hypothetical protein
MRQAEQGQPRPATTHELMIRTTKAAKQLIAGAGTVDDVWYQPGSTEGGRPSGSAATVAAKPAADGVVCYCRLVAARIVVAMAPARQ